MATQWSHHLHKTMNHFSSLLKFSKGKPPADAQATAQRDFPTRVQKSRLKLRSPGEPVAATGKQFIIGIATYSAPELELMDKLEHFLEQTDAESIDVEVFDVLSCKTMSDFASFIPDIDGVYRTPIIGVICDGKLIDHATGLPDVLTTLHRFHILNNS
jgi:hypothetical protein